MHRAHFCSALPALVLPIQQETRESTPLPFTDNEVYKIWACFQERSHTELCPLVLQPVVLLCRKTAHKTQSVLPMVPMPTTHARVLCRCCPSVVKAWLGLVTEIYLDWCLNKIQSDSKHQIQTILTLEVTETSVTLRGWTAYIHPAGLTDINEGTVWYNATSTFLTNQEWRLICLQFKWTLLTMGRYQPFMSLLWQEGKKPSSMKEPCFASPPHCFPAVQTALSDSPDPQCLLPSFPTNGSEKYL